MSRETYCPHCGEPLHLPTFRSERLGLSPPWSFGFEYRSKRAVLGFPLLHVAFGYNPQTGLPRVACGIIAIGNFAFGLVALGGIAGGGIVISGIGLGLLVLAGVAVGWGAVGGVALGYDLAIGGLALSLGQALGGLALVITL